MNWNHIKENWDVISRTIMLTWGKLSEDDLKSISGDHDRLVNMLKDKYVISLPVAESRVEEFVRGLRS